MGVAFALVGQALLPIARDPPRQADRAGPDQLIRRDRPALRLDQEHGSNEGDRPQLAATP
jgi:hypothetical protein